ncbi:hypothetical protein, partial [Stieleria sp.]|uniref:hypothetical protein n=1 Tax=Stieleria sp. TaxID=2795976 RepID=UPI003564ECB3
HLDSLPLGETAFAQQANAREGSCCEQGWSKNGLVKKWVGQKMGWSKNELGVNSSPSKALLF